MNPLVESEGGELRSDFQSVLTAFNPLRHPACLAEPLYSAPSTWHGHNPFAMWLISVLRPKVLVELGTYYGCSYCAMCQAKAAVGYAANFFAVDTWAGDVHTGPYSESVLDRFRRHHDPKYSGFSQLIREDFNTAANRFSENSIELLHIDGAHTYKDVLNDWTTWLPKVNRERGVVLFHDVAVRDVEKIEVWQAWDEIRPAFPHFDFSHSKGLGVLGVGTKLPSDLTQLFSLSPDEIELVRKLFVTLGSAHSLRDEVRELGQEIDDGDLRLNSVTSSFSWRLTAPLRQARTFVRGIWAENKAPQK